MSTVAIRVEGLGKKYRIGANAQPYKTLRESLSGVAAAPLRAVSHLTGRLAQGARGDRPEFWALRDVNFRVAHGEVVGIIGRNGAGKSTLLKLLSQITEPTTGEIGINGRVASLLEVGTGFHPELTGRENILLNGAILGMSRTEIMRKFDEIVSFAEVEQFIDTQVKHYSSGMYLRLAFSVAAHLEPEILVVDEVLAVGDVQFQKKCLGKMGEVAGQGRTVLFVSHNMGAVQSLCTRGIWLDGGRVEVNGAVASVVSQYLNSVFEKGLVSEEHSRSSDPVQIRKVVITNIRGELTTEFQPGDGLRVEIHCFAPEGVERPHFWIGIDSQYGPMCGADMLIDGHCPSYVEGESIIACTFRTLPLLPQTYRVRMGIRAKDGITKLTPNRDIGFFNVTGRMRDFGFYGELADMEVAGSSPMVLPYEWHLADLQRVPVQTLVREV